MSLWRSIGGMLEVELTSAELEKMLQAVSENGIPIFKMKQTSELSCCVHILRKDHKKLARLVKSRGESLKLIRHSGVFWTASTLLSRPVLITGCIVLLLAVWYLPTRVLFVRVEGNKMVPAQKILESAEECGISFGASRKSVRSEKMKNDLLGAVEQLQWAGVNTSGCVATISVRERSDTELEETIPDISNIVADQDGYILSGTVTKGTPLFQPGQTVQKGQILISGYTDCGFCIQAARAEGEVMAQTTRELEAVTPQNCVRHGSATQIRRKISLLLRKKRINLWKDSGISEGSCGRMYEEYYATLPGGFRLPIALCIEEYYDCDTKTAEILSEEADRALCEFARGYIVQQTISGEIQTCEETVTCENGVYRIHGKYSCTEMIGREQPEQMGDTNGKND